MGGEESDGEDWARGVKSGTRQGFTKSTPKRRGLQQKFRTVDFQDCCFNIITLVRSNVSTIIKFH